MHRCVDASIHACIRACVRTYSYLPVPTHPPTHTHTHVYYIPVSKSAIVVGLDELSSSACNDGTPQLGRPNPHLVHSQKPHFSSVYRCLLEILSMFKQQFPGIQAYLWLLLPSFVGLYRHLSWHYHFAWLKCPFSAETFQFFQLCT